jgi:hypothetical protein
MLSQFTALMVFVPSTSTIATGILLESAHLEEVISQDIRHLVRVLGTP